MSTDGLCERFKWSAESDVRNELTGRYEPVQPFVLLAMTRKLGNALFVDAGANIGFYTVVIGSEPTVAEVFAFEPMPASASAIRWNARANLSDKAVVIREIALSDQRGDLEFAVRGPFAGDNGALQDSHLDRGDFEIQRVRCGLLDDELQAEGRDIVVKIDVEGHELRLLQGATRTFAENRGFLQIEMHASPSHPRKIALLNDLGWYQLFRVGADYYFTNIAEYAHSDAFRAEILESAMGILVEASKDATRASRRRIAPGVHLQVSRRHVDAIKGILRR